MAERYDQCSASCTSDCAHCKGHFVIKGLRARIWPVPDHIDAEHTPNLSIFASGASPEQAEAIFEAAMDAAFDKAAELGVDVGGAGRLA